MANRWQSDSENDTDSDHESEDSGGELDPVEAANLVKNEPMYYVLNRFLETVENKNVATCINELTAEVRALTLLLSQRLPLPLQTPTPTEDPV